MSGDALIEFLSTSSAGFEMFGVRDLHHNLTSAAVVLRFARRLYPQLRAATLDEFFQRLAALEVRDRSRSPHRPFVLVVEGLDGSGKSTLAARLSLRLNATMMRTPPETLSHLRSHFDAIPGPVARAFYMACNYFLADDMHTQCSDRGEDCIFVVDRWFASTLASAV